MARTYAPSNISRLVELWKADLAKVSVRAASSLADPDTYPNLFPDFSTARKAEEIVKYVC